MTRSVHKAGRLEQQSYRFLIGPLGIARPVCPLVAMAADYKQAIAPDYISKALKPDELTKRLKVSLMQLSAWIKRPVDRQTHRFEQLRSV